MFVYRKDDYSVVSATGLAADDIRDLFPSSVYCAGGLWRFWTFAAIPYVSPLALPVPLRQVYRHATAGRVLYFTYVVIARPRRIVLLGTISKPPFNVYRWLGAQRVSFERLDGAPAGVVFAVVRVRELLYKVREEESACTRCGRRVVAGRCRNVPGRCNIARPLRCDPASITIARDSTARTFDDIAATLVHAHAPSQS